MLALLINGLANCIYRTEQTLTTPNTGAWIDTSEYKNHTFYVTATGVATNVVFQFEGSPNGVSTANIEDSESTFTLTANTTKFYYFPNLAIPLARINWISKSGTGTTPNITMSYIGGK